MKDQIGTTDASYLLGVTQDQIRKYIKSGRLDAERIGGVWVIPAIAVRAFTKNPVGRPRKQN